ncbi:MAG: YabP/YqfC family sporulation protein [Christensenellales bacterium]
MDEQKVGIHKIGATERNNLNISGVMKVLSSNTNTIVLKLKETDLMVCGTNLSIESFVDGNILVLGTLDQLKYSKTSKNKEGFFKRIFK